MRSPPDQGQMISCNERKLWKQIITPLSCLQNKWRKDTPKHHYSNLLPYPSIGMQLPTSMGNDFKHTADLGDLRPVFT